MNYEEIINLDTTKTEKIRVLLNEGLSRRQVADALGVGYGFVQNVYAKAYPDRVIDATVAAKKKRAKKAEPSYAERAEIIPDELGH